ncbi:hypothetical protein T4D_9092 [Trichinella pseudospiralis]|uniref:Uncharacterized protein n=1 Tax=Trichinella pseudospiralis TaxID=6337 RepID=A0A0V1FWU7_TRIPS|nr:hypothetical protein T4D_9092 [Trichinella pseudospiralis]
MLMVMESVQKRLKREMESAGALCYDLFIVIWYLKAKFASVVSSLDDCCIQYIPTIVVDCQLLLLSFKRSFISFTQPVVDKSIRIHIALIKRRRHFANTR